MCLSEEIPYESCASPQSRDQKIQPMQTSTRTPWFGPKMARLARIDSQLRAGRLIVANRFRVPELIPFLCESRFSTKARP